VTCAVVPLSTEQIDLSTNFLGKAAGVVAVFADGVDVAAEVEPVLGDVLAGEPRRYFCWVLMGRTPRSEMLLVGQIRVS
jgi:hypothetical protein